MALTRRTRAYRRESGRTSGAGALIDTVRHTLQDLTSGHGPRRRRRR